MVFSSTVFLFLFLPLVLLIYFLSPQALKNTVLLAASLFFYAWGEPKFVIIMMISILLNYIFGLLVDKYRDKKTKVKWILIVMVFANILILGIFKYANFIIENVNSLFSLNIENPNIPLPIGISFFTFQAISYVIDIYRKDGDVQKNPLDTALYISLFPQLVAGPIVRYQTVANQIKKRTVTLEGFTEGIKRFIVGLAKKMLLANNCGLIADQIFSMQPSEMSTGLAWIGIIAYSLQIYFDFSGYSDMAIGLGRMFGFTFLENFNYPYISKSISEFWRRWHISLGSWSRDYIYIPLGGNRKGNLITYRNLFIVWLTTGIWHGANWTFIIWGLYYGFFIMIERAYLGKKLVRLPIIIQHAYALIIVIIGWVFFRSETLGYAFEYIGVMFGINSVSFWNLDASYYFNENIILFLLSILVSMGILPYLQRKLDCIISKPALIAREGIAYIYYIALLITSVSYIISSSFNPFIYFNF